jgi:hypothetical protein
MIRHIFPSNEISQWCTSINKLLCVDENVCECAIENIIQNCPTSQQQDLVNGLFWSLWIDQVFYYITYDGGVRPYLRYCFKGTNTDLYQEFRTTYPFPKIHAHYGSGQMSPMTLFNNQFSYNKPTNKQLLEGRKDFWGEIKDWLKYKNRAEIIAQFICAFREDFKERFTTEYEFLIDRL